MNDSSNIIKVQLEKEEVNNLVSKGWKEWLYHISEKNTADFDIFFNDAI